MYWPQLIAAPLNQHPRAVMPARALETPKRVLAIFAHPDDEIGCAGTLARFAHDGAEVQLIWMTHGELASQFGEMAPEQVAQTREAHGQAVAALLGARQEFLNFPDAGLTGGREEALALARIVAAFKPEAIITWDPFDMHPDHRATYWACLSSLKLCRIPKLMGAAYRERVRLYHYYSGDLPRDQVYCDISETMPTLEHVYRLYHETYHWAWTVDDLRRSRLLVGARFARPYAERFQEANLNANEALPA